jgi:hypothetical protein
MNWKKLGRNQKAILRLLWEQDWIRTELLTEIRSRFYNKDIYKRESRLAFSNAIRTLQERGLIQIDYGIVHLTDRKLWKKEMWTKIKW